MRCAVGWRRSTKPRAWIGCRHISITACRHCCKSPGSSMPTRRSSRCTARRKAPWWATTRTSPVGPRAMLERDWTDSGQGWQGKETSLRLMGWSRQRRVILLRRKLDRPVTVVDRTQPALPQLSFAEVAGKREVWEYAALVTSLHSEILTLGPLYRDRADCENGFDELKNHWGWGGFTT